jgi:hypothetical protein
MRYTVKILDSIAKEKAGRFLSTTYIDNKTPYSWECKYGHKFEKALNNIMLGQWCPMCSAGKTERFCRFCFTELFSVDFPKKKNLDWLRNSRGNKMELDGYNEELQVAFEYQGKQHTAFVKKFQRDLTDLLQRKEDDLQKARLCAEHGIRLIVVPESLTTYEFEDFIKSRCKELDIAVPKGTKVDYSRYNSDADGILNEMIAIARSRNGECLSKIALNSQDRLDFYCNVHQYKWSAAPYSIRQGRWCRKCGLERTKQKDPRILKIEDLKEYAISFGGECLSDSYTGKNEKLRWKCKNVSHPEYWATPSSVRIGKYLGCLECSGKKRLTIDDMRTHAARHGGRCLTEALTLRGKTTVEFECNRYPEHDRFTKTATEIKNNPDLWCPRCPRGKVDKHDLGYVQSVAQRNRCTCLSPVYSSVHTAMDWKCLDCGYEFSIDFKTLQTREKRGRGWCDRCNALYKVRLRARI